MRQLGLFGGSEARPAAARKGVQGEFFDGSDWMRAASDWCWGRGLCLTGYESPERFAVAGWEGWLSIRWDGSAWVVTDAAGVVVV